MKAEFYAATVGGVIINSAQSETLYQTSDEVHYFY